MYSTIEIKARLIYNYIKLIGVSFAKLGALCMIDTKKDMLGAVIPCRIERGFPVVRVLICDDDRLFLNKIFALVQSCFSNTGVKAKIHTYSCWEEIGTPILDSYDIAILDLDFSGKPYTGIDIAKSLRKVRQDSVIIFLTNYIEYAPEGYEVQAFRYILKSDLNRKLDSCLNLALSQLRASQEVIKIQINGELIDIRLNNILYFESQQHTIIVHVQKGTTQKQYLFYSSLTTLETQLAPNGFLRIHKSYLVNMNKLKKYQCHEAILTDGTTLRVSEKNYSQQKEKYLRWKGR